MKITNQRAFYYEADGTKVDTYTVEFESPDLTEEEVRKWGTVPVTE